MMAIPATSVSVGVVAGTAVASYPGQLPRTGLISAIVVGVCSVLGAVAGLVLAHWFGGGSRRARVRTLTAGGVVFIGLIGLATWWQHVLRQALDLPEVEWIWPICTGLPAIVVIAVVAVPTRLRAWCIVAAGAVVVGYWSPTSANAHRTSSVPVGFDAPQISQRAHDVVERWVADGGLRQPAVVVAVPTGSGWIDTAASDGFRRRLGQDVPVLGLQYANVSSWRAFVTDRDAAGRAAVVLLAELDAALRTVETAQRPDVVLYGQSLGAIGADAARRWALTHGVDVIETVEVGVPGDSVPRAASRRATLANATDPVARWSPSLLWRPARLSDDVEVIGRRGPTVPWLPLVSFLQTSADLLSALDVPVGVGHRYGPEQGMRPAGVTGLGSRTASSE